MLRKSGISLTLLFSIVLAHSTALARTITVSGRGLERSYCNANSGYFCLDNVKRGAQADAGRDAQRVCELSYRGRSLTYTTAYYTSCSPSHLPPHHDGTWVQCSATASMQCEVN